MSSIQLPSFVLRGAKEPLTNRRWLQLMQVNGLNLTHEFRMGKLVGYLAVEKLDI